MLSSGLQAGGRWHVTASAPPSPADTVPSGCDSTWNAGQRGETPLKRADRNFADLLQELRVAQTGVQILFAFLLGLAFTDRFAELGDTERGIYIATLAACALTEALLVAPVMLHRLLFQCGLKRGLRSGSDTGS